MRIEKNIYNRLTQKNSQHELPPNKTFGLSIAPVISLKKYQQSLRSLGFKSPKELPKSFDWRKIFKLSPVMNQQSCGCCWAMASTSSYTDRWMVAKQKDGLVLDPLPLIVCITDSNKCGGGYPEHCQNYFGDKGGVKLNSSPTCLDWDSYCVDNKRCVGDDYNPPGISCEQLVCNGGFKAVVGGMKTCTLIDKEKLSIIDTINSIKTNIKLHGPVVAKFQVFGDFTVSENGLVVQGGKSIKWNNTNGVYINGSYDKQLSSLFKQISYENNMQTDSDKEKLKILEKGLMPVTNDGSVTGEVPSQHSMGFHAVEIVGWDVDPDYGEYWIVKNSWGPEWNDDGYFKFAINNDGKTNANCGMDIPIIIGDNQLFGGTVSFLPDVENSNVDWEGTSFDISKYDLTTSNNNSSNNNSSNNNSSNNNWYVWVLIILSIIILTLFIYVLYNKYK